MDKLTLIKVGGKIVEEQETLKGLGTWRRSVGHRHGLPLGDREPNGRRSSHYG